MGSVPECDCFIAGAEGWQHASSCACVLAERDRYRDALDTIATGHAFGPIEVARVALGLKSEHEHRWRPVGMTNPPDHYECSDPGCQATREDLDETNLAFGV